MRHDDDHHDGSENSRKDTALRVGFSRLRAENRPHIRNIDPALVKQGHLVRVEGPNDLSDRDLFFSSVRIHHEHGVLVELRAERFQFYGFFLVAGFHCSDLSLEVLDRAISDGDR